MNSVLMDYTMYFYVSLLSSTIICTIKNIINISHHYIIQYENQNINAQNKNNYMNTSP